MLVILVHQWLEFFNYLNILKESVILVYTYIK
jgi:hypothetical protein